ncbi:transposase, partial [Cupriavidus sp. CV2]|uniref:transposase n=1 Tax=Cupriavidus ulmosensis TaxID=3065913 RepID=UPI00296ACFF8
YKTMTLDAGEFMRRFLLHVLPGGFHRIRHYGLLANPVRRANLARARELLDVASAVTAAPDDTELAMPTPFVCRHCGAPMLIIEIIPRSVCIRGPPPQRVLA